MNYFASSAPVLRPLPLWERRIAYYLGRVAAAGTSLGIEYPMQWCTGHRQIRPKCACCADTRVTGFRRNVPYCKEHEVRVVLEVDMVAEELRLGPPDDTNSSPRRVARTPRCSDEDKPGWYRDSAGGADPSGPVESAGVGVHSLNPAGAAVQGAP